MRKVLIALLSVAVFLVLLLFFMWAMQSRLIFFPDRAITLDPSSAGLEFEDVYLKTSDGHTIHGWFVRNKKSSQALLFCHGNAGNISGRVGIVRDLYDLGLNVFIFDYSGYGNSEGSPSEKATYADAEAAWRWLTESKEFGAQNTFVMGRSLGAAVALFIAEKKKPLGLIIESAFLSVPDMARHEFPFLPVSFLPIYQYPNKTRIGRIKCPVLIIHSRQDELIPFDHGKTLFDLAHEPKTFLEIEGSHNDGIFVSNQKYMKAVSDFIRL